MQVGFYAKSYNAFLKNLRLQYENHDDKPASQMGPVFCWKVSLEVL